MSFSTNMQNTVTSLLSKLGNSCTINKIDVGRYDPSTGTTRDTTTTINTYSTSIKNHELIYSLGDATGYNLSGMGADKVMIPYQSGYEIDTTWKYGDDNINKVEKIESQNNIIAYILEVGTK